MKNTGVKKTNFACPDLHRFSRQGIPEAVYCPGKSVDQILKIVAEMVKHSSPVILTRADEKIYRAVKKKFRTAKYHKLAKIVSLNPVRPKTSPHRYVCVITAGTTDIPVAEEAAVTCEVLGNRVERIYDVGVAGIHRIFGHKDKISGASCVIVCAGMEGALPSIVGGLARSAVIGVPTSVGYGASFGGLSALLTMLNSCTPNVCCVNIDDGFGAGIIASLINEKSSR